MAGAQAPGYDDARWQTVGLPHSFSLPYFMSPDFYVGYGWYRRHVSLPTSVAGRRVALEFEGVFQEAEVFVNGARVGAHIGGYTDLLDITDVVKPGEQPGCGAREQRLEPSRGSRAGEHCSAAASTVTSTPWSPIRCTSTGTARS